MKTKKVYIVVAGLAVLALLSVATADAEQWFVNVSWETPISWTYINPCQDVWQAVEASGTEHWTLKLRQNLDQEGGLESWDVHIHFNHQNGNGVGYDLEMETPGSFNEGGEVKLDDDGKVIRLVDEDGNFITTDYEVPGHWQWVQNVNKQENINEVYICHLISHGKTGNLLIHINRSLVFKMVDENGDIDDPANWVVELDGEEIQDGASLGNITEHVWCKCAGAGPDANGVVDCDEFPDNCIEPPNPYAGAFWH